MRIINFVVSRIIIFLRIKKNWHKPIQSRVLIYDHVFSEVFSKYIDKNITEVYHNRFDETSLINFYIVFKCFLDFDFKLKKYKEKYFKCVNPKIIISIDDNNLSFYKLKKKFPDIVFIAIQKSWKYDTEFDIIHKRHFYNNNNEFYCDFLFCYNKHVAEEYLKFIKVKKVFYIGSFKSNSVKIERNKKKKIIFISQWRNYPKNLRYHKNITFGDWQKNETPFLQKLSKFLLKQSIKIIVLGKNKVLEEKKYYDKIFKNNYTFVPQYYKRQHYKILDSSLLAISLDSTLGYENLSRGNRTIFFSIRSNKKKILKC
jgi:surface carbohydrate biosynthesis protein